MSGLAANPLTIMFWPESAYGPTNQCIGLAAILRDRGHTIVFAAESSWAGKLAPFGFIEELVDLAEPAEGASDEDAGAFWTDFIAETAPEFRKPTVEQLESFIQPTYQALIDGAKYCEPRLREIIARAPTRRHRRGQRRAVPGVGDLGCAVRADRVVQPAGGHRPGRAAAVLRAAQRRPQPVGRLPSRVRPHPPRDVGRLRRLGAGSGRRRRCPTWSSCRATTAANLYVYPAEADYLDARPLDDTWTRMDSSVRETDDEYELPAEVADRPDDSALVYLSLGSLGGADVELMQRLVDVLGTTRHRFIVSKGPQADRITLADNMVGAQMLPQTKVIPQVDLVISHGGNNTVTETLHFGKPLIVLPLFWDQYENAQRIDELGFGVRLDTYAFADDELTGAVDRLLADTALAHAACRHGRGDPRT